MKKENIIVIFGGKSAEHDISIITGLQVLKNVDRTKFNIFPLYISKSGKMYFGKELENFESYINFNRKKHKQVFIKVGENYIYTKNNFSKIKIEVACAILCNHGLNGEDGTIQGLLELCGIPYTSSSVLSSSICMDKAYMKNILEVNEILTPKYFSFTKTEYYLNESQILQTLQDKFNLFNDFCFIKPANLGSSIGISKCKTKEELEEGIEIAFSYDEKIVVEKSIENAVEVNCAILGNKDYQTISNLEYPKSWSSFLNFDEKYISRQNAEINSKQVLDKELENKVKEIAKKAFIAFDCSGVVRIDFLVDVKNRIVYLNELNSIPGSLAFYLFKDQISFSGLITRLIDFGKKKFEEKQKNKFSYTSNALLNFGQGNKMNKYTNK